MSTPNIHFDRRSFLKVSATAGGGMLVGLSWTASAAELDEALPADPIAFNAFVKISPDGVITLMSPNPEVGQNIKTAMPMLVAEELDCDWTKVRVEQAGLDSTKYTRQVAGGSGSIPASWKPLRTAGATARQMLINAAAKRWSVSPAECSTDMGVVMHKASGKKATYGELATEAAAMEVPKDVSLKAVKDFKIIGKSLKAVDNKKVFNGKQEFGFDFKREGMLYCVVAHPPAFGMKIKTLNDTRAKSMPGIAQVLRFGNKVAVLGKSTWEVLKARERLSIEWEVDTKLESTADHDAKMAELLTKPLEKPQRKDGDALAKFEGAHKVLESTFEGPFLPHAPMEPMNFFAHVKEDSAELIGSTQNPSSALRAAAQVTGLPENKISVMMTRMGGGFGRRLNSDFVSEAVEISKLAKAPVKLMWTREDDMTGGIYRPAAHYLYRAALDAQGNIIGFHARGAGLNVGNPLRENNFPAGALTDYLAEGHNFQSNITTGPWRAPVHNFLAFAEQSFLDEIAIATGKDPVQMRLDLLAQAEKSPVGTVPYKIDRFRNTIELAAKKANWGKAPAGVFQGFSAYFSFNTYVAQVVEVTVEAGQPKIKRVVCAIDCGIVVNPEHARNQIEGGMVDGIGHAMFGQLTFKDGAPEQSNFDTYRIIRMADTPPIEVHFVENELDPTGLGEPTLPPISAALGNAIFRATGIRLRKQPFSQNGIKNA
ncbi:xanthine dehydrogenase family protein molybdopterin-binding subunit [Haliscomenobacter hydrossis]|uniref:Aldehyde dehydrogenase (Pyrroloquinoline-quinone) n=1 Tax=Haliscomenobacter hydrossis (strain ATCC 27775 / DSM 1100 / LMG 10767 / O) TaxID=760192 RepID=F4KXG7_HALH1|nr:molybdopterin cofactor-binding domain-containing protein [Haliscomenobacter hydrossis]AEE50338.1 Aldehyde dehydrogenase (pyrroloquinoline-quinone) [Haliscomenobacter hydrossis DSM 1100]